MTGRNILCGAVGGGLIVAAVVAVTSGAPRGNGLSQVNFSPLNLMPQISRLEAAAGTGTALEKAKLAALYLKQGKLTGDVTWHDKAEATARESLALLPKGNPVAKLALAETLEKRHLFAQSLGLAKEALAESPGSAEALANYATINLAIGEIDEAFRAIEPAVKLSPTTANLTVLSSVLTARGRDAEAELELRRALAAETSDNPQTAAATRMAYARLLLAKGRYAEAEGMIQEALRIVPGQYTALGILGDLRVKRGEWKEAAKAFSESFAASPQVSPLRKFARAKRMLGDERGAEDAMREALALARREIASGVHAHPLELAYVLIAGKDPEGWKEAIQLATDELKVRHNVLPWNALAQAQEKAGHLEAASESISAVLRTGTRNPDYFLLAAKVAKGLGDATRARLYYELALSEDKNLKEATDGIKAVDSQPAPRKVAQNP